MRDVIWWMPHLWWPCNIGFCPTEKAWDQLMKSKGIKEFYSHTEGGKQLGVFTTFIGYPPYDFGLMTIAPELDTKDPIDLSGLVVHECVHAFQFVAQVMNERDPSPEFQAYGTQQIYLFMMNAYQKSRLDHIDGKKNQKAKVDRRPTASRIARD